MGQEASLKVAKGKEKTSQVQHLTTWSRAGLVRCKGWGGVGQAKGLGSPPLEKVQVVPFKKLVGACGGHGKHQQLSDEMHWPWPLSMMSQSGT